MDIFTPVSSCNLFMEFPLGLSSFPTKLNCNIRGKIKSGTWSLFLINGGKNEYMCKWRCPFLLPTEKTWPVLKCSPVIRHLLSKDLAFHFPFITAGKRCNVACDKSMQLCSVCSALEVNGSLIWDPSEDVRLSIRWPELPPSQCILLPFMVDHVILALKPITSAATLSWRSVMRYSQK